MRVVPLPASGSYTIASLSVPSIIGVGIGSRGFWLGWRVVLEWLGELEDCGRVVPVEPVLALPAVGDRFVRA